MPYVSKPMKLVTVWFTEEEKAFLDELAKTEDVTLSKALPRSFRLAWRGRRTGAAGRPSGWKRDVARMAKHVPHSEERFLARGAARPAPLCQRGLGVRAGEVWLPAELQASGGPAHLPVVRRSSRRSRSAIREGGPVPKHGQHRRWRRFRRDWTKSGELRYAVHWLGRCGQAAPWGVLPAQGCAAVPRRAGSGAAARQLYDAPSERLRGIPGRVPSGRERAARAGPRRSSARRNRCVASAGPVAGSLKRSRPRASRKP